MSDAPQGEGWWQASDGRWYPPQTPSEAAAPTPAAPTSPPFAEPGGVAGGPGAPLGPPPGAAPSGGSGGGGGKAVIGVVALLVGALLGAGITWAVTGGGGSDDGDDWSAFCDRASELEAEAGGEELSDEEGQAAFAELVALAPQDYQELLAPLEAMADGGSTEDIDAFGDAFGAIFYLAAILEVECGLDMGDDSLLGGGDMGLDTEGSFELDGGDLGLDEGTEDTTDVTSDAGIDEEFFEDEEPAGPMDIDSIQAWLDENHADAPWLSLLSSWTVSNEEFVVVAPYDEPLSDEDALAACDAIAEYVWQHAPEGTVEVATPSNETQARGEAGGACELVG